MSKPKVLVSILTGVERQNWINPDLSINLVQMARDSRFTVNYFPVRDARPWDTARNITVRMARELNVDWILSFDNDNFMQCNPLDIIAAAGKDKHVIGVDYGGGSCTGIITQNDGRHGYAMFSHMSPPVPNGAIDGPFKEVNHVPGGVLMIRNTVWQQIPGPWFVWQTGQRRAAFGQLLPRRHLFLQSRAAARIQSLEIPAARRTLPNHGHNGNGLHARSVNRAGERRTTYLIF